MYIMYKEQKVFIESVDDLKMLSKSETKSVTTKKKATYTGNGRRRQVSTRKGSFKPEELEWLWEISQMKLPSMKDMVIKFDEKFPGRSYDVLTEYGRQIIGKKRATGKIARFMAEKKEVIPKSIREAGVMEN